MSVEAYVTEIYCQNSDCKVREMQINAKQCTEAPETVSWTCPACKRRVVTHWQRTQDQHLEEELRQAVATVNAALYKRDTGNLFIPPTVMLRTKLPKSWRYVERDDE